MNRSGKSKNVAARVKPNNRRQKEKQTWKKVDVKRIGNTRLRRISGKR
ncbi:MAG: hypothetical protein L0Y73_03715 [Candidatus Aminicenantes bacterium]|nr:hypothetical protein [Candidatus Aminicenantes bacterium]